MTEPIEEARAPRSTPAECEAGADHFGAIRATIESAAAAGFGVAVADLRARTRSVASAAFARQAAIYVAHVALGLTYSDAGRLFGRDRTTAAHACRVVEERRDDPRVDAQVQSLECACQTLCGRSGDPGLAR
jgi:chromosomal replication initiation ATPase DnaA